MTEKWLADFLTGIWIYLVRIIEWLDRLWKELQDPEGRERVIVRVKAHIREYVVYYVFAVVLFVGIYGLWSYERGENADSVARGSSQGKVKKIVMTGGGDPDSPNNSTVGHGSGQVISYYSKSQELRPGEIAGSGRPGAASGTASNPIERVTAYRLTASGNFAAPKYQTELGSTHKPIIHKHENAAAPQSAQSVQPVDVKNREMKGNFLEPVVEKRKRNSIGGLPVNKIESTFDTVVPERLQSGTVGGIQGRLPGPVNLDAVGKLNRGNQRLLSGNEINKDSAERLNIKPPVNKVSRDTQTNKLSSAEFGVQAGPNMSNMGTGSERGYLNISPDNKTSNIQRFGSHTNVERQGPRQLSMSEQVDVNIPGLRPGVLNFANLGESSTDDPNIKTPKQTGESGSQTNLQAGGLPPAAPAASTQAGGGNPPAAPAASTQADGGGNPPAAPAAAQSTTQAGGGTGITSVSSSTGISLSLGGRGGQSGGQQTSNPFAAARAQQPPSQQQGGNPQQQQQQPPSQQQGGNPQQQQQQQPQQQQQTQQVQQPQASSTNVGEDINTDLIGKAVAADKEKRAKKAAKKTQRMGESKQLKDIINEKSKATKRSTAGSAEAGQLYKKVKQGLHTQFTRAGNILFNVLIGIGLTAAAATEILRRAGYIPAETVVKTLSKI